MYVAFSCYSTQLLAKQKYLEKGQSCKIQIRIQIWIFGSSLSNIYYYKTLYINKELFIFKLWWRGQGGNFLSLWSSPGRMLDCVTELSAGDSKGRWNRWKSNECTVTQEEPEQKASTNWCFQTSEKNPPKSKNSRSGGVFHQVLGNFEGLFCFVLNAVSQYLNFNAFLI